jgi:hypothetical protein
MSANLHMKLALIFYWCKAILGELHVNLYREMHPKFDIQFILQKMLGKYVLTRYIRGHLVFLKHKKSYPLLSDQ